MQNTNASVTRLPSQSNRSASILAGGWKLLAKILNCGSIDLQQSLFLDSSRGMRIAQPAKVQTHASVHPNREIELCLIEWPME
jgi:hypothetical protein